MRGSPVEWNARSSAPALFGDDDDDDDDDATFNYINDDKPATSSSFGKSSWVVGLDCDLRTQGTLPAGVELKGPLDTPPCFEEQDDGSMAVHVPSSSHLELRLNNVPAWSLNDDKKLSKYSVLLALRTDKLPLSLFAGGPPATDGAKALEQIMIHANGSVSLPGVMSVPRGRVKAGRWAWIAITRDQGIICTYVNGIAVSQHELKTHGIEAKKRKETDAKAKKSQKNPWKPAEVEPPEPDADKEKPKKETEAEKKETEAEKKERLKREKEKQEQYCLDPCKIALFYSPPTPQPGASPDEDERGLWLKYLKVSNSCWTADVVRKEMDALRGRDEEQDVVQESARSQSQHLILATSGLYGAAPPIWGHSAFAAEFGDAFVKGTGLEAGQLHASLDVFVVAVDAMLQPEGLAESLPLEQRTALSTASSLLHGASKLAARLAAPLAGAKSNYGQDGAFLRTIVNWNLADLRPGGTTIIPFEVGHAPILFVIRRYATPCHDCCTLALVSCDPATLDFHRCRPEPPKLKVETVLELSDVRLVKLRDEAFWAVAFYAGLKATGPAGSTSKLSPLRLMYQLLLSFLADDSFDQAVLKSDARRGAGPELHSARLSATAHHGVARHALRYLLRCQSMSPAECKKVSLMLRLQYLQLAKHDLGVVRYVCPADRAVLQLATRQLAYKAAKAARLLPAPGEAGSSSDAAAHVLSDAALTTVRVTIEELHARLGALPGAELALFSPPPLVLCEADDHLGHPSLPALLDAHAGGSLLVPSGPRSTARVEVGPALEGVAVLGLYFAAAANTACPSVTRALAAAYAKLARPQPDKPRLEIVLVCLDECSEDEYEQYRCTMPWLALPYDDASSLSVRLCDRFDIRAVPTLVLLRADGTLLSADGVRLLRKHARAFPWGDKKQTPQMPHLSPLLDRVVPRGHVNHGPLTELPRYRAIDFLQQDAKASTLDEAIHAIRLCDELTTSLAVQSHCIKNVSNLKVALIEHTFTHLLPLPLPEKDEHVQHSVWAQPISYSQQLDLLLLLQALHACRLVEHFAASTFSTTHTPASDAVRIVVPGCIAIVADAVMRRAAFDHPSQCCVALARFTIGCADLAKQSATVPCFSPELNVARARVLDYFDAQTDKVAIFPWQNGLSAHGCTELFMETACTPRAFPKDSRSKMSYLSSVDALMIKNFPEFRCYRDIAFYLKYFLNKDLSAFPDASQEWSQESAQLSFEPAGPHCEPYLIETEDDVLHVPELPDFGTSSELGTDGLRALGQHDAELLLSYLTVPYLRVPLVVSFFAADDRIHSLQAPKLQELLDACLFEPGHHLPRAVASEVPTEVPTPQPERLGTTSGLLINELRCSPDTTLNSVIALAEQASTLDTGSPAD